MKGRLELRDAIGTSSDSLLNVQNALLDL